MALLTGPATDRDPLARVEREITVLLRRTLEEVWAGGYGNGPVDRYTYPVLALLHEHGPQGLTELTRRLGISKPTTSRHVARLGAAALVATAPDRGDPRAVVVTLTPQGGAQVARVRTARRERLREVLRSWSDADGEALADLLARLNLDLDAHRR
ncbi:MarR family winged helix-turn-helix transcriptional regulator [Pseudonocardia sp. GCM10023141]|uniref:MarR family winged helix-turn-helix transcriptional regulator n=1 Tax=Pseudonocardia sp. GCM10023141 TaxID=3252653 RepID=UPI00360EB736